MPPVSGGCDYRAGFDIAVAPRTTYQQCLALTRGSGGGLRFVSHCLSSSRVDVVFILTVGFG